MRSGLCLLAVVCLLLPGPSSGAAAPRVEIPQISAESVRGGYSLAGQWRFHPGDDFTWASPELDDRSWTGMDLPGRWPQEGFPASNQIGWYRLALKFNVDNAQVLQNLPELGLRIGKVHSAYEFYAGGQLLGGVGKLPPLSEVNYDRERVYRIPAGAIAADGTLVLAMRVWGGEEGAIRNWGGGPHAGEFSLGEYTSQVQSSIAGELPGLLINVLFIGFGLYHLYLYRRNSHLRTCLWFGLMAITMGIYGLMLNQLKYSLDLSFLSFKKIEFAAIYLFPALAIQMIWSLLGQPIGRWLRAYQLSFVAAALMVTAVPGHGIHYATLNYWQLWTLPLLVLAPWVVLRELRAGNSEARTVVVGVLIFTATCVNDLLIDLAQVQTVRLLPFGFLAILLSMVVSMTNRFTSILDELEDRVQERTAELSAANLQLAAAARLDPLTGVLNRRGFAEEAEAEVQRVFRSGRTFTLVLADVDNFKVFNDRHGHACGDHVLVRVASIIRGNVRDVDRIARWGGEEFIVLLPETDVQGAAILAEKLRESVAENLFEFDDQSLSVTMTFGIAGYRTGESLESCLARADTALYQGKEQGRNKVMVGNYKGLTLVS